MTLMNFLLQSIICISTFTEIGKTIDWAKLQLIFFWSTSSREWKNLSDKHVESSILGN